jgi:hypothetical protein
VAENNSLFHGENLGKDNLRGRADGHSPPAVRIER